MNQKPASMDAGIHWRAVAAPETQASVLPTADLIRVCNSPFSNISRMMSLPPTSSPLTHSWGRSASWHRWAGWREFRGSAGCRRKRTSPQPITAGSRGRRSHTAAHWASPSCTAAPGCWRSALDGFDDIHGLPRLDTVAGHCTGKPLGKPSARLGYVAAQRPSLLRFSPARPSTEDLRLCLLSG